MQYEGVVDVFQTVRILRAQRTAMVQTEVRVSLGILNHIESLVKNGNQIYGKNLFQEQYQFCYRAALEYLGSFDHYTT